MSGLTTKRKTVVTGMTGGWSRQMRENKLSSHVVTGKNIFAQKGPLFPRNAQGTGHDFQTHTPVTTPTGTVIPSTETGLLPRATAASASSVINFSCVPPTAM